jgi:hypothetical protein
MCSPQSASLTDRQPRCSPRCSTKLVQPSPGRVVAAQPKNTLHAEGAGAVLLADPPPDCPEPHGQRRPRVLEEGSRRHRDLASACRAHLHASRRLPAASRAALRTHEAVRPAKASEVLPACLLCGELGLELPKGAGEVFHHPDHYPLWLLDSRTCPLPVKTTQRASRWALREGGLPGRVGTSFDPLRPGRSSRSLVYTRGDSASRLLCGHPR